MPLSIEDVNYSYPIAPTIGSADISATQSVIGNSIGTIRDAYNELFADYNTKADTLLGMVSKILGKGPSNKLTPDDLKRVADIFDNDDIINGSLEGDNYKECKEGLKAYKFYLKEVITKLGDLYRIIGEAESVISDLNDISEDKEDILNNKAHVFISQLEIYDKQAQDIFKAFTEFSVVKNLIVKKYITYNDGLTIHDNELIDNRTYECIEKQYRDWGKIIEKTEKISLTEGLYKIKPEKKNILRVYETTYKNADGDYADKYDLLAQIEVTCTNENVDKEATSSNMALFDELTLLEKLQYIHIYYSDTLAKRYVYPADNSYGYPCIQPPESTDALNDTKELGQVEMFYLGYIMDRDGPINALASFLEIKTTAIKTQIKVLMERIKAIKAYSTLLQKGFEEFSSVAANYGQSNYINGRPSIPIAAFYIYRYLSTSATRCFYYIDGTPYIMIQYSYAGMKVGDSSDYMELDYGKGVDKPDGSFHESRSQNYILVRADEDGLNGFVKFLNEDDKRLPSVDGIPDIQYRVLDILFAYPGWENIDNHYTINPYSSYVCCYHPRNVKLTSDYKFTYDLQLDNYNPIYVNPLITNSTGDFEIKDNYKSSVKFKHIENKYDLPKELDVPKLLGSNVTQVPWKDGMSWNDLTPDSSDGSLRKEELSSLISVWKGNFETVIANYNTSLDQQEKEITTLQKKIQTFDATSTNFRNKAFTVYNKIVNKIK